MSAGIPSEDGHLELMEASGRMNELRDAAADIRKKSLYAQLQGTGNIFPSSSLSSSLLNVLPQDSSFSKHVNDHMWDIRKES